jgi:hypothetical protein
MFSFVRLELAVNNFLLFVILYEELEDINTYAYIILKKRWTFLFIGKKEVPAILHTAQKFN